MKDLEEKIRTSALDARAKATELRKMMDNRAKRSFSKEEIVGIALFLEELADLLDAAETNADNVS